MVFGIIGVVNFAHGDVCMLSTFIALIIFFGADTEIRLNANPLLVGLLIDGQTGNVGIGTTQPARLLTLEGGPEVALRLRDKSVPTSAYWELQPTAFLRDHFGIVRYEGGAAQASKSLVIKPDGTVGIGTTTPRRDYALHVHQTGSHLGGVFAESDTGAGLAAETHSPDFVAMSASNDFGVAFRAGGSETDRNGSGVDGRGFIAVRGESQNGAGVLGITHSAQAPNATGTGVVGQCFGNGTGVSAYSAEGIGLSANSGNGDGLIVFANATTAWCGKFTSITSKGVYVSVPAGQPGLQVASGTKSAIVPTSHGSRSLYSEEATEVWFSDYGFGQLEGGMRSSPLIHSSPKRLT